MHSYNKLGLWDLAEYKRVVYLEPENLVLENMDDLFLCGPMCAVHINPLVYINSLWVVTPRDKPTRDIVKQSLDEMRERGQLRGIEQGFIPG